MSTKKLWSSRVVVAACAAALAVSAAGCSTSSDDVGGNGSAQYVPAPEAPVIPPDTIRLDIPLTQKPEAGKMIGYVSPASPQGTYYGEQLKTATAALGWNSRDFTFTNDAGAAISAAVGAKVDYIYLQNAGDKATFKPQLEAAKKAGIPLINNGTTDESDPAGGYYTVSRDGSDYSEALADWTINDSKGTANVVLVTMLEYPYFQGTRNVIEKRYAQGCSGCKLGVLDVTTAEAGAGSVPAKLVSYLQSNPDVDYVYFQFSDILTNVAPTLKSAGLADRVKIITGTGTKVALEQLADGDIAATTQYAQAAAPWTIVDLAARLSVNEPITAELLNSPGYKFGTAPTWMIVDPEVAKTWAAEPFGWPGPEGFQDQFKSLWLVS